MKPRSSNLALRVFESQLTGRPVGSLGRLPEGVLARLPAAEQAVALLAVKLNELYASRDVISCAQAIQVITLKTRAASRSCEVFVAIGGDVLLSRILCSPFSHWNCRNESVLGILKRESLMLFQELCMRFDFYREVLAATDEVLKHLFLMLPNPILFELAVFLIEEILAARDENLDLRSIPDFTMLLHNLSSRQLGSFCRLLASVVFEPEDRSCDYDEHVERRACIVDINHARILSVPDILARLVKLLQQEKQFHYEHQMEIMLVLCALCRGKEGEQVQNRLGELGLVEVLSAIFDCLDWKVHGTKNGVQGSDCLCDPETALKIQYLRLIHNFCDRDGCNRANKHLLMKCRCTCSEGQPEDSLLVKVVFALLREPGDSPYRFWLASCVEAFLRGADAECQDFVAEAGIMEHLVIEILKGGLSCPTSLQVNFDLLGELVKFNDKLLKRLNNLLSEGDKFSRFVEVLVLNLVDSNVFVRSVLLSLDWLRPSYSRRRSWKPSTHVGYRFNEANTSECCKLSSFMANNLFRLLCDLMTAVQIGDINQDNICVLNTALIFFIFAERDGELQSCLDQLKKNVNTVKQFRSLLDFWTRYYIRRRPRDCISLEYNTGIAFTEWTRIVDHLCKDPSSPFSQ